MFCRKCGHQMAEHATVCDSCNTRTKPAVYCHKCASELPANSTRCINCNAKSRAHKRGSHWLPILFAFVALIFYAMGGYYYNGMPYATVMDYLALLVSVGALIMSIVAIPSTRVVLKIFGILLNGIMLFLSVTWILGALF